MERHLSDNISECKLINYMDKNFSVFMESDYSTAIQVATLNLDSKEDSLIDESKEETKLKSPNSRYSEIFSEDLTRGTIEYQLQNTPATLAEGFSILEGEIILDEISAKWEKTSTSINGRLILTNYKIFFEIYDKKILDEFKIR